MRRESFEAFALDLLSRVPQPLTEEEVERVEDAIARMQDVSWTLRRRAAAWRSQRRAQPHRPVENVERDFLIRYLIRDVAPRTSLSKADAQEIVQTAAGIGRTRMFEILRPPPEPPMKYPKFPGK